MRNRDSDRQRHSVAAIAEHLESRRLFSTLFASDANGNLGTIDTNQSPLDATAHVIGNMGVVMADIAFSPQGALYGVDNTSNLYRINPSTAQVTYIGPLGIFVNSLAFSASGTLYAASDSLWTVNTSTGSVTLIGGLGGFQSAGDLVFDDTGSLFMTATSGDLVQVDPTAASFRDIGPIGDTEVWGLAYGDHTLYGLTADSNSVITIDPITGEGNLDEIFAGLGQITGADAAPATLLPQSPTYLSASQGASTNQIRLAWQPALNATAYDVWRSITNDLSSATEIASGLTTTAYTDTSIQSDTTYYYWVDASSLLGTSAVTSPVSGVASSTIFILDAQMANGNPAVNATVSLLDGTGNRLATQTPENDGSTLWTQLSAGTARFGLYGPNGDLWAENSYTIRSGSTGASITQDEPFESNLRVLIGSKDVTGTTVAAKTQLTFVLSVHNPTATTATVRANVSVSNPTLNKSFTLPTATRSIPPSGTVDFRCSYTPTAAGIFLSAFQVHTRIATSYIGTDSGTGLTGITVPNTISSRLSVGAIDSSNLIHGSVSALTASVPASALLRVQNKLALFMNVDQQIVGSTTFQPVAMLAGSGLILPQAQMIYQATFTHPNDALIITISMGITAGIWNILDVLVGRSAIPSPSALSTVLGDLTTLPSLQQAYSDLIHPSGSKILQVLRLVDDLRGLLSNETQAAFLTTELAGLGFNTTASELLHVLNVGTYYQFAKQLVSLAALHGQLFSGYPIDVTFTAAPVGRR